MLDYDNLEELEIYALAADITERRQLLEAPTPGGGSMTVKPGQAFLAGLFALECGDLAAARDQVQRLKSLAPYSSCDHFRRLEALVALRSWPHDPAATTDYLQESCGLAFNASPPPPTAETAEGHLTQRSQSIQDGASSVLDPSLYSDRAVLQKVVQIARGPGSAGAAALPTLLSRAGMAAALSYDGVYDLGLSIDERLQVTAPALDLLSGDPTLTQLARDAVRDTAHRGAAMESLLPYMASEQLDELFSMLPPGVATSPAMLAAVVRKMYGSHGAVSGVAAAIDAANGVAAAVTSHATPVLTAVEADAIRRRVLQLCERLRQQGAAGDGEQQVAAHHERLAWLEARALMPLTEGAVHRAVVAEAAAAAAAAGPAEGGGGASISAAAAQAAAAEAEGLMSRLLSILGLPGVPAGDHLGALVARKQGSSSPAGWPISPVEPHAALQLLGPALRPLPCNAGNVVRQLLGTLLQVAANPPALFAPGGALVGLLDPAAQDLLLSETMLTRGSLIPPPSPPPVEGAAAVDWAAVYRSAGGRLSHLAGAMELEVMGPEIGGERGWEEPGEDVCLFLTHKGVKHISILVYDIDTEAYYREKGEEVGLGINLEGLGATFQLEIELPLGLQALTRIRRLVQLPQLRGRRGVWVVEVQGGGLQSRAVLRRGALAGLVRCSPAGMALTLLREDGSPVGNPRVWVDGRLYSASPRARIAASAGGDAAAGAVTSAAATACEVLVPYRASEDRVVAAVLVDGDVNFDGGGGFASLMLLQHVTETYDFTCGMHFELESAAAGGRGGAAPLLLQPGLTIGGWTAPLELLQDVSLTVEVENFDSVATCSGARRQVFQDWKTGDGLQAATVQVRLPDRPSSVTAVLTARLRRLAQGSDGETEYQSFRVVNRWELNQSDMAASCGRDGGGQKPDIRDLHLTRGSSGNYLLRLLGKAGEPQPGAQVIVALTHEFSAQREPPLEATESASAPPLPNTATGGSIATPGGAAGGSGGDDAAFGSASCGSVLRWALMTDANGTIDLGQLYGITAVAASVALMGAADGVNRRRRQYCWRLTPPLCRGGSAGGATCLVLRALGVSGAAAAGEEGRVQCTIPIGVNAACRALDPELQRQLRRRLGVALVSLAAAAAFRTSCVRAHGSPVALPEPPPVPRSSDWPVAERLDERHVTVRQGCVQVMGLPPGVYGLYIRRLDLAVTLLVYGGPIVGPATAIDTAPPASPASLAIKANVTGADTGTGDGVGAGSEAFPHATAGGGATGGGFVLQCGMIAPLSEARPLQVADLRASVAGGVVARLEGSSEQLASAVVVVVLSRFESHFGRPQEAVTRSTLPSRPTLVTRAGVAAGVAPPGSYQSGRRLNDEVRYVLERRRLAVEGRVRPMPALVDRPSLLVQPWKVREAATSARAAARGEAFMNEPEELSLPGHGTYTGLRPVCLTAAGRHWCMEPGGGGGGREGYLCHSGDWQPCVAVAAQEQASTLGLAFCCPAVVLANVDMAPDGVVHLTPEQLAAAVAAAVAPAGVRVSAATDHWLAAGHRLVRLIAYTAPAGVSAGDFGTYAYCEERTVVEGAPDPSWTDPRVTTALQRPFPAGSTCVERRACQSLQPGDDLIIDDAASAKLQLYGTVQKVWALYGSLLSMSPGSPVIPHQLSAGGSASSFWSQFSCIGGWSRLSSSAKLERYSQLACRELAFFCYCHDPDFFRWALLPCLRLRLPSSRTLLDCWMAGERGRQLVDTWGAPHRYTKLTPLERILLAREEDHLERDSATAEGREPQQQQASPTPRLARLAADMRARLRSRVAALPRYVASSVAEVKRRRFDIALNGPGHEDRESQDKDVLRQLGDAAFEDLPAASTSRPPPQRPMSLSAAAVPPPQQPLMEGPIAAPMAAPQVAAAAVGGGGAPPANRLPMMERLFATVEEDMARRKLIAPAAPAYRSPPTTQEWAEAGWFRRPPSEPLDPQSISPESELWADLAEHLSRGGRLGPPIPASSPSKAPDEVVAPPTLLLPGNDGAALPFLPRNLESAGWSFSDALLATAVVGVPWVEAPPLCVARGTRLNLTAAASMVAYVCQTAAVAAAIDNDTVFPATTAVPEGHTDAPSQPLQQLKPQLKQAGTAGGGLVVIQRLLDPNLDPSDVAARPRGDNPSTALAPGVAAGGGDDGYDGRPEEEADEGQLQDSDGVELPRGSPLEYGRLYCYAVVVSNTGPNSLRVDVTVQAPQGAVALGGRPALWVHAMDVLAYGACRIPTYYFYFPRPSEAALPSAGLIAGAAPTWYDTFPTSVSSRGRVLAVALDQNSRVQVLPSLPAPATLDLVASGGGVAAWSWQRLAALPASPEADTARLRYLQEGDVSTAELGLVLWRCRDAAFWRAAVAALRRRRVWNQQLWSYAVFHRDEQALRELIPSLEPLTALLGSEAPAAGPLVNQGPGAAARAAAPGHETEVSSAACCWSSADRPPHMEYWPLVNPRAHLLGGRRATLNEALERSWRLLLERIAAVHAGGQPLSSEDLLAASYYLVLQDRPAEASALADRLKLQQRISHAPSTAFGNGGGAATANSNTSSSESENEEQQELQLTYLHAWLILADPATSAEELQKAAALVRKWMRTAESDGAVMPSAVPPPEVTATAAALAAADGGLTEMVVSEPRWQSRLAVMLEALEDAAAAAAAAYMRSASGGGPGGVGEMRAEAGEAAAQQGAGAKVVATAPELLLYDNPYGPRGALVLQTSGLTKVTLSAHFMDLELLFSMAPFDTALLPPNSGSVVAAGGKTAGSSAAMMSDSGSSRHRFSFLRPGWTRTIDLKDAAECLSAATSYRLEERGGLISVLEVRSGISTKLRIQPHLLVQQQSLLHREQQQASNLAAADRSRVPPLTAAEAAATAVGGGSSGRALNSGAILLEASAIVDAADDGAINAAAARTDPLRQAVVWYNCGMRVAVRKDHGVVAVTHMDSGAPVAGAYVKVYVLPKGISATTAAAAAAAGDGSDAGAASAASFHKDGYTDRRGLLDFWTLTTKPGSKVGSVALLVSHPELGVTVMHTEPPLH